MIYESRLEITTLAASEQTVAFVRRVRGEHMLCDSLIYSDRFRMRVLELTVDTSTNENGIGLNMQERRRVDAAPRAVVRPGHNVGTQMLAEEFVNPVPSFCLSIAGDEVAEPGLTEASELHNEAAVVGAVHILDMGRENLEAEVIRKAVEVTRVQTIDPY